MAVHEYKKLRPELPESCDKNLNVFRICTMQSADGTQPLSDINDRMPLLA
jgi:hypothetical protein